MQLPGTLIQLLHLLNLRSYNGPPAVYQLTPPIDHGEGPIWDPRRDTLYYVNIHAGEVLSYHYSSGRIYKMRFHGDVTPVIPSRHDPELFLVGVNRSMQAVKWDGVGEVHGTRLLGVVSPQFPTSRFNDGKADKEGRLWWGTMGFENRTGVVPNQGVLYRITKTNYLEPDPVIAPVNISNGMAWNKANDKFYYIDTPSRKILQFDYNNTKGEITNPRVVFDLSRQSSITGFPDGMTIDENDNLWVALYNGGAVIQVDPRRGALLKVIAIPASAVTSVAWGGPNLNILFVTTSRFQLGAEERKRQPAAGSLFAVTKLGCKGLGDNFADIVHSIKVG